MKNNVSIPRLKMNHRKAIYKGQNIEGTDLVSKITEQLLFVKLRVWGRGVEAIQENTS